MYENAKELIGAFGLGQIKVKENIPNPYNKRSRSTLMWGKKA